MAGVTWTAVGDWRVGVLVDDDGHLNVFISNGDEDVIEVETGQGSGKDGEELALRFTTPSIEAEAG